MFTPKRKFVQTTVFGAKPAAGRHYSPLNDGRLDALFESKVFGSVCERAEKFVLIENAIWERYAALNGTQHKEFVCCPHCAFVDAKCITDDKFASHDTIVAYCVAEGVAARFREWNIIELLRGERDKLQERADYLETEIQLMHHEREMAMRDKANKRARKEKSGQSSSS